MSRYRRLSAPPSYIDPIDYRIAMGYKLDIESDIEHFIYNNGYVPDDYYD